MTVPLSRNRNYRLLWATQALSEFGINGSMIAFPLLVLAITGSAAVSGLVLGTAAAAQLIAGLPAGALVDRWSRKKVMLCCEAAEAAAAASLVGALWWNVPSVAHMVVVAAVLGVSGSLFGPAEEACLPHLVPAEQLSTAVAMNSARSGLGQLSGTAAGGFLFAVGRAVPFAVEVLTHAVAFVGLAFLRIPPREQRRAPVRHLGREIVAGLRWVWRVPPVRVTMLCAVVLNLFFSAFYVLIIVLAAERGVPAGEIGVMAAMLGVGGVLGSLLAPYACRVLSPYASIAAVFWALTLLTPVAIVIHNGYLMGALFAAMALLPPTANTTIITEQMLMAEDAMRGRLSAVLGVLSGVAATAGPALGGFLVEAVPGSRAVLVCAAGMAAITVVVTVSPTLRRFSRHRPEEEPAVAETDFEPPVEPEGETTRSPRQPAVAGLPGTPPEAPPAPGIAVSASAEPRNGRPWPRPRAVGATKGGGPAARNGHLDNGQPALTATAVPAPPDSGPEIVGTVWRADGTGLADAVVTVTDPAGRQEARTATASDGGYRLPVPHAGTYLIVAASGTFPPHAVMVAVADCPVRHDVTLTGVSGAHGVIRTADLAGGSCPVAGIAVTLIDVRGDVAATVVSDTVGRYHIAGVPDGQYTLTAAGSCYQPAAVSVLLPAGTSTERDVELPRRARLLGTVVAASTGRGVGEALATLVGPTGAVVGSTVTDADGSFAFDGLAEGSYTLTARGYAPVATVVQVTAGRPTTSQIALAAPTLGAEHTDEATARDGDRHVARSGDRVDVRSVR